MQRKFILLAAASATLAAGIPALAQDSMSEVSSRIVRYDDLNLVNQRGRERLEVRVRSAANAACGTKLARTLQEKQAAQTCRDTAIANTKPKVEEAVRDAKSRR